MSRLTGVVYLEAFHYPYHSVFQRVREIIEAGGVGVIRHIDAPLWMPARRTTTRGGPSSWPVAR